MGLLDVFKPKKKENTNFVEVLADINAVPPDQEPAVAVELPKKTVKKSVVKKTATKKSTPKKKPTVVKIHKPTQKEIDSEKRKQAATKKGEPYFEVLGCELDSYDGRAQGQFTLDWNSIFVENLRIAGYQGKNEESVIDNWYRDVCRSVANEEWEQFQAATPGNGKKKTPKNGE